MLSCYYNIKKEVVSMSISNNKTRTMLTIEKELKQKLEQIAKNQERSFNNLIIKILKEYVQ